MYSIRCDGSRTHFFFFFNDTATTEIYTLSLHDALPICSAVCADNAAADDIVWSQDGQDRNRRGLAQPRRKDRKSTRLNSSHSQISYAVFCLKKKNRPTNRSSAPGALPAPPPASSPTGCT